MTEGLQTPEEVVGELDSTSKTTSREPSPETFTTPVQALELAMRSFQLVMNRDTAEEASTIGANKTLDRKALTSLSTTDKRLIQFQKLPLEIRRQIYEFVGYGNARVVSVIGLGRDHDYAMSIKCSGPTPTIMHISQDARRWAQQKLRLVADGMPCPVHINLEQDVLRCSDYGTYQELVIDIHGRRRNLEITLHGSDLRERLKYLVPDNTTVNDIQRHPDPIGSLGGRVAVIIDPQYNNSTPSEQRTVYEQLDGLEWDDFDEDGLDVPVNIRAGHINIRRLISDTIDNVFTMTI